MIRILISFVVGVVVTSAAWQGYAMKRDYDLVSREWRNVVRVDHLRASSIRSLLAAMKRSADERSDVSQPVDDDLNALAQRTEDEIVSSPAKFEIYDRARKQLSTDLKELTKAIYADRSFLTNAHLIPIVSQVEGTESAAVRAEFDYDSAAEKYLQEGTGPVSLVAQRLMRLPNRVGRFEAFGDAGPAQAGTNSDDDDD